MTRDETIRGDLRVQRTRQIIVEALIALTIRKGLATVTVQDIVKRTGINRATFYRHYQGKFDLLDRYVQAVYALPDDLPGSGAQDPGWPDGMDVAEETIISGLARLLGHVRTHAEFFRVMHGTNGDPAFA